MAIFNNVNHSLPPAVKKWAKPLEGNIIPEGPFIGIQDLRPSLNDRKKDDFVQTNFYFSCNEVEQEKTLAALATAASSDKTVHLGFSMNFNFDVIARRSSHYAIIADIAPQMLQCYQDLTHCILKSSNRQEFAQNFQQLLKEHAEYYFGLEKGQDISMLCNLCKEVSRPGSWLSTDEGFSIVKKMHEEGRVLYLKLNLAHSIDGFQSIQHWIRNKGLTLDTVYLSNIPEWLHPSNESPSPAALQYIDNIREIIEPTTYVIDAYKEDKRMHPHPVQRVLRGKVELPSYVIPKKTTTTQSGEPIKRKALSFSPEKQNTSIVRNIVRKLDPWPLESQQINSLQTNDTDSDNCLDL